MDLKRFQAAIHDFNIAIDLKPKLHELYFYRGMSKIEIREELSAINDFEK